MKKNYLFVCVLLVLTLFTLSCQKKRKVVTVEERQQIKEEIIQRKLFYTEKALLLRDTTTVSFDSILINKVYQHDSAVAETKKFYVQNGFKTRWLYLDKPSLLLDSYFENLQQSVYYGFNPETYRLSALQQKVKQVYTVHYDTLAITELDKEITASFLLFAKHLVNGRIEKPAFKDKIWRKADKSLNQVNFLLKITENEDLKKTLEALHPNTEYYVWLREELENFKTDSEDTIRQFSFPKTKDFKTGYQDSNVVFLRHNLALKGFPTKPDSLPEMVDDSLLVKIKEFQLSKRIKDDGLPGSRTLYYLNMTKEYEKKLLILNLERLRWLNADLENKFILVNIPEFKLYVFNDQKVELEMNVITGTEFTPTPVFSNRLKYLVFRPTWSVPQSIVRKEMIPQLIKNSAYYTRRGFTIYENGQVVDPTTVNWSSNSVSKRYFNFVEKPSAGNALGLVKFIFPNDLDVYLHDTPTDNLFSRDHRAFSHGCIRLEKPAELATYLLKDQDEWTYEKVLEAMNSGADKRIVYLDKQIPVQIFYLTAYVNSEKKLMIFNDVYGFDQYQLRILELEYGL